MSRAFGKSSQWQYMYAIVTCFQRNATMAIYVCNCHVLSENRHNGNTYLFATVTSFQRIVTIALYMCNCHVLSGIVTMAIYILCAIVTSFQRIVSMAIYLCNCHVLSENRHNGRPRSSDSWTCSWSLLRLPLHPPC